MSSPRRDCAVQTPSSPTGLTLAVDGVADAQAVDAPARCPKSTGHCTESSCECSASVQHGVRWPRQQQMPVNASAAQRHFAKYEPHQLQEISDDVELGWDCAICLETAEDPCVTRCGHLYCQAHLNHWLSTHPSCPVCKTLCTPSQDVVPIFSRGRTSPAPSSSIPSSPASATPFEDEYYQDRYAPYAPLTPQSRSGSPTPTQWPHGMTESDCIMADYDIIPDEPVLSSPPLPRVSPPASSPPPVTAMQRHPHPHPHPLMASHLLAHYLGIALRIVGLAILLGVLLR